jgi:two-component system, NtrC family, response regulator AtoC
MKLLPRALVIDDEPSVLGFVAEVLRSDGWTITEAENADQAYQAMQAESFDLVFCDVMLGSTDGYSVLRRFAADQPGARFVLMTGHGSAAGALDATAIGAFDYLVKPFSVSDVLRIAEVVREQISRRSAAGTARDIDISSAPGYTSDIPLIGKSPRFVECLKMVGRVAPTSLPVLITGESGTGKEIVANAIHRRSKRADGPFITVNCGAIPVELIESELFGHAKGSFTGASGDRMGLWEEAAGGTLFLDEITETPPQFQVKLLRALQESEIRRVGANRTIKVDARIICATNRDIEQEVIEGRFRQDLMYRMNAVTIKLPPLRERAEDIPLLASHFASRVAASKVSFAADASKTLKSYPWPGNVRELENAVLHAVSMADDVIYPEHLPERVRTNGSPAGSHPSPPPNGGDPLDIEFVPGEIPSLAEMEVRYVTRVLHYTGGNKQAAARVLNIDRKTLGRILARGDSELT